MIEEVIKKYSNSTSYINGWDTMKKAAVAILMVDVDNETNIIFEVRAFHMRSQPGDISFPGGKIEDDESAENAVKREVCEELGLNIDDFEIVTPLNLLVTHYGLIIHPFLGYVKNYNNININTDEVDHIFLTSLDKLLKIEPLKVISKLNVDRNKEFPFHLINGGEKYKFKEGIYKSLFYNYGEYNIWGMTALILEDFLKVIKNES
ncbi:NUDIX hydrolase [Clostridium nigeriense]|uniref:NUDIX hydrolase n=1 Tax=Clostridium nigeriense TaxID=1805470 RepID=UPI003D343168